MYRFRYTTLFLTLSLAFPQAFANQAAEASAPAPKMSSPSGQEKPEKQEQKKEKKPGFFSRAAQKAGNLLHSAEQDAESGEGRLPVKYPVEIRTGEEAMKTMLETYLPLIQHQKQEDLDKEQIGFLAEDAPNDIRNMLKTEGYFNTQVNVRPQENGYVVEAELGERTYVGNVGIAIGGDILQDNGLGVYYKDAAANWKLPVGSPFRQEDWAASKTAVLAAVTRKKYPLAKFARTRAVINPATRRADLNIDVDSGKAVYFGDLDISGNRRYPDSVIRGLAKFKNGDPYDLDLLLDYQQALENNNHYSGASVQADFDNIRDNRVPVKVAVSEVKRQKFEAGLRFDSEYGLGGSLGYDHYNLFNRGYTGSVYIEADRYQTTVGAGISQPRNSKGNFFTSNLSYSRSTTQKLEKRALSGGIWHVRDRNRSEWRYGVEFIAEDSKIPNSKIILGKSYATMLTAAWKYQNIQTQMRPTNGYYLDAKIGTTLGKLLSSAMTARARASGGYYFTPENHKLGTVMLRGNIGYVYTNEKEASGEVPASLMFRTGGASTVRGYELDSIGRRVADSNAVLPDRAMMTWGAEYQYPIKESFALAIFHDAGGVARTFQDIKLRQGTGLGLRWFSPAAPFSFDVAYGHHDKRLRWHINLGTRF